MIIDPEVSSSTSKFHFPSKTAEFALIEPISLHDLTLSELFQSFMDPA